MTINDCYVNLANAVVFQAVVDVAENEAKKFFYGDKMPEEWFDGLLEQCQMRANKKKYPLIQTKGIFPTEEDYVKYLYDNARRARIRQWHTLERDAISAMEFLRDEKRLGVFTAVDSKTVVDGVKSTTQRLITDTFEKIWEMAERREKDGKKDIFIPTHRRYRRTCSYNRSQSETGD